MELYRNKSSYPKVNAQDNLCGRTHYVDDGTLKFHHSRIISARAMSNGLLFAIVTSDALNYEATKRGFRYVVFDVFGNTIARTRLEDAYATSAKAEKAMWKAIDAIDDIAVTREAIEQAERNHASEMNDLRERLMTIIVASKPAA